MMTKTTGQKQAAGKSTPTKRKTAGQGAGGKPLPTPEEPPPMQAQKYPRRRQPMYTGKKKFTKKEDNLIKEKYGVLTVQQIADRLGRSRAGVNNRIKALGLLEAKREKENILSMKEAEYKRLSVFSAVTSGSRLTALIALRDALAKAIDIAPAKEIPRLSKELTEILKQIDEIDRDSSSKAKGSMVNVIRANFNGGKPKAKAQG
jgi:hypothetical protein